MRRIATIVVAVIVGLLCLAAVGMLVLPRQVAVRRTIVIDAPAAAVWPLVSDLARYAEWAPWATIDPEGTRVTVDGPPAEAGQTMRWSSDHPNVGRGSVTIAAIAPEHTVETVLTFGAAATATAGLSVTPDDGTSVVAWTFATDLGVNPLARLFGLKFETWAGRDYETGLARLKALAEGGAAGDRVEPD